MSELDRVSTVTDLSAPEDASGAPAWTPPAGDLVHELGARLLTGALQQSASQQP